MSFEAIASRKARFRPEFLGYALGVVALVPMVVEILTITSSGSGVFQLTRRFALIGVWLTQVAWLLISVTILSVTSSCLGHRRTLRTLSLGSWFLTMVLVGALGLYLLDLLEIRSIVAESGRTAFTTTTLKSAAQGALAVIVMFSLAVSTWQVSHRPSSLVKRGRVDIPLVTARKTSSD